MTDAKPDLFVLAVDELIAMARRDNVVNGITAQEAVDGIRESILKQVAQLSTERHRLIHLLDLHRRFHGKVGCPGQDCYVCQEDQ